MRDMAIIGDCMVGTFDGEAPLPRRVVRTTLVIVILPALVVPQAHSGIIENTVKSGP